MLTFFKENEEITLVHPIWNDQPAIQKGLLEVKTIMRQELRISHPQVKNKIQEYMDASGKYIRAGLLLMMAQTVEGAIKEAKLYFAAAIEVLHLATLIHDDVIDEADTRRGISAMHKSYTNRIAVYSGDYLLTYSARLMKKGTELLSQEGELNNSFDERIIERILAGELAQLLNQHRLDMTLKDYLKQIKGKTAFLFALALQLGAWTPSAEAKPLRYAFNAGQAIGMAFQLSDDLLDYQVGQGQMGKPALQDIQNGIYTAPLLFALEEDKTLTRYLSQEVFSAQNLYNLQAKISATSAYTKTETIIQNYLAKSELFLRKMNLGNETTFVNFLDTIMKRKF